ncbi:MAG: hypothetical protein ACE5E8_11805 [Acidimicrobiia bacterium]
MSHYEDEPLLYDHEQTMSQREKVLLMLQRRGQAGVCSTEMLDYYIPRFGARLDELKLEYPWERIPCPGHRGQYRYRLIPTGQGRLL